MSAKRKTVIGIIFGGRSVEHDVSVVTANQIMRAFDANRYEIVPIYITRDGKWYTGDPLLKLDNFQHDSLIAQNDVQACILSPDVRHHGLILNPLAGRFNKSEVKRLDIVFPAVHGSHGEDGTLQGLFELADIPFVGCATMSSSLTNDKIITKQILRQVGIPVVEDVHFSRADWQENSDELVLKIKEKLGYPVFIKPATLGSSIGVGRADDDLLLRTSIDIAANFDQRIIVETAITEGIEINCAVLGNNDNLEASVLEQPVSWDEFLSYEDKYLRGDEGMKSADRIIPAPISDELTEHIQDISQQAFKAVNGSGTARIDYLMKPDSNEIYLNEMNTMPGSLAFYLWRESGMSASQVVERLVQLARNAHAEKRSNMYDYKTNLISVASARGVKGTKGIKQ